MLSRAAKRAVQPIKSIVIKRHISQTKVGQVDDS